MNNFFDLIYNSLHYNRKKELVVWAEHEKSVTYTGADLLTKISSFRSAIEKIRSKPGQKIIPAIPTSCDTLCALLAIQSLGMVAVSPPANLKLIRFAFFIWREGIHAIIFEKKQNMVARLLLRIIGVKILSKSEPTLPPHWKTTEVLPAQTALISYTSGSTGKSKAIYRSHKVLAAQHHAIKTAFAPFANQVDFPLFPNILLHNLIVGVKSVLPNIEHWKLENLNPELVIQQIKNFGITSLTGNVFYYNRLLAYLKVNPQYFSGVKALGVGGSPVNDTLVHLLKHYFIKADCYIIYGSSEAEPIAVRKVETHSHNPLMGFYVGKPVEGISININETDEIETPNGIFKTGEIEVKGAHVTAKNNTWLKTGDFGYLTKENDLYLTARQGNQLTHSKIQHYQIENVLLQQAKIKKVAAISSAMGYYIFVEGAVNKEKIWQIVQGNFSENTVKTIEFDTKIPVDARHHSKILYAKMKNELGI